MAAPRTQLTRAQHQQQAAPQLLSTSPALAVVCSQRVVLWCLGSALIPCCLDPRQPQGTAGTDPQRLAQAPVQVTASSSSMVQGCRTALGVPEASSCPHPWMCTPRSRAQAAAAMHIMVMQWSLPQPLLPALQPELRMHPGLAKALGWGQR